IFFCFFFFFDREELYIFFFFFFQAEDGIRDFHVTGVQTCALPIYCSALRVCSQYWAPVIRVTRVAIQKRVCAAMAKGPCTPGSCGSSGKAPQAATTSSMASAVSCSVVFHLASIVTGSLTPLPAPTSRSALTVNSRKRIRPAGSSTI